MIARERLTFSLLEEIKAPEDKPKAAFARLTEDHWIVNVTVNCGAASGSGATPHEALASLGLGSDEVEYLMQPANHSIEDLRDE